MSGGPVCNVRQNAMPATTFHLPDFLLLQAQACSESSAAFELPLLYSWTLHPSCDEHTVAKLTKYWGCLPVGNCSLRHMQLRMCPESCATMCSSPCIGDMRNASLRGLRVDQAKFCLVKSIIVYVRYATRAAIWESCVSLMQINVCPRYNLHAQLSQALMQVDTSNTVDMTSPLWVLYPIQGQHNVTQQCVDWLESQIRLCP